MTRLRVATFNIAGGVGADSRFYSRRGTAATAVRVRKARAALAEIARWARDAEVDVLALQEVDVCWSGAETLRQGEELARMLGVGWRCAFLPGFDYDVGGIGRWTVTTGVATLVRAPWEIAGRREHRFSQRRLGLVRRVKGRVLGAKAALEVMVRTETGESVTVINAHLTHDDDRQREYELETLLEACAGAGRRMVCVLAGDLNTTPPSTRGEAMREAAHFATDRCFEVLGRYRFAWDESLPCTYPASGGGTVPDLKLDYVLVFGGAEAQAAKETVGPSVGGSNHLPVCVTIEVPDGDRDGDSPSLRSP